MTGSTCRLLPVFRVLMEGIDTADVLKEHNESAEVDELPELELPLPLELCCIRRWGKALK